jgi:hypothetical protein
MITVNGYRIANILQAGQLYIDDRINKRQFKKVRNYFDARRKADAMRQAAAEVEDLESAWDTPGVFDPLVSPQNANDTAAVTF